MNEKISIHLKFSLLGLIAAIGVYGPILYFNKNIEDNLLLIECINPLPYLLFALGHYLWLTPKNTNWVSIITVGVPLYIVCVLIGYFSFMVVFTQNYFGKVIYALLLLILFGGKTILFFRIANKEPIHRTKKTFGSALLGALAAALLIGLFFAYIMVFYQRLHSYNLLLLSTLSIASFILAFNLVLFAYSILQSPKSQTNDTL